MEDTEKESISNFSFAELKLLITMSIIKKPKVFTLSMLAEMINTQQSAPKFVTVCDFLKDAGIMTVHPYIGNTKVVVIDDSKLTDIIDEHEITNFFYSYFKEWHVVAW